MKYNTIAGTEEKVSAIALGTWVFGGENWGGADDQAAVDAVKEALGSGMTFIDTAPFYTDGKAEELVGQALKGRREDAFIATKCGLVRAGGRVAFDLTPGSILREVDLSLKRLQCDVIDLYQCHWPDPATPIEKSMETLLQLQSQGKVRHLGVCNFDLPLLQRAVKSAPIKTLQVQYSLLERSIERELMPFCIENDIRIIAYGSLGGGILTGKYQKPPQFSKRDARKMFYKFYEGQTFSKVQEGLEQLRTLGRPLNEIALNWVRQQQVVLTVLAGSRNAEQAFANARATEWDLTTEEIEKVSSVSFS